MFRFKEFKVYKDAKDFAAFCEKWIVDLDWRKNKELIAQIRSAYLSIMRSAHEVVAASDLALSLDLINDKIQHDLEMRAEELCKQINGFRKSLNKKL